MDFIDNPLVMRNYLFDVLEQKIETFPLEEEKTQLKLTVEALKELILLDVGDARILKFFTDLSQFTISIALGIYNVRIQTGDPKDKDVFFSVGVMLNQMAEELEARSIPNNYLNVTLNTITKPAFICDEKKRILYTNEKFLKLSRFTKDEIKGKTLTSFISVIIGNEVNGNRDKLLLHRKNTSPIEILLRMHPIEATHPLDRSGLLYTLSHIN